MARRAGGIPFSLIASAGLAIALAVSAAPWDAALERGRSLMEHGKWEEAAAVLRSSADERRGVGDVPGEFDCAVLAAEACQRLGEDDVAGPLLERALDLAVKHRWRERLVQVKRAMGVSRMLQRDFHSAEQLFRESLAGAEVLHLSREAAQSANNLAAALGLLGEHDAARACLAKALCAAETSGETDTVAEVLVNTARHYAFEGDMESSEFTLGRAGHEIEKLPLSRKKSELWAHVGQTWELILARSSSFRIEEPDRVWKALASAQAVAAEMNDARSLASIMGALAALYQNQDRMEEALACSRLATFQAQTTGALELVFRSEWQSARILRSLGKVAEAMRCYRRALRSFQECETGFPRRSDIDEAPFRESTGLVFIEVADLLLREAGAIGDPGNAAQYLAEARNAFELLHSSELRDYFRDDCAAWLRSKSKPADMVSDRTAVIHLIPLPDRTELLVSIRGRLQRLVVPVSGPVLESAARELRGLLEKRTTYEFLPIAQEVHAWLVHPASELLESAGIDTLVWVLDGAMRLVPLAALHDGRQYLIERYAVGVIPGLTLLDPQPVQSRRLKPLVAGLSVTADGNPPLEHVAGELDTIQRMFRSKVLRDRDFVYSQLERELEHGNYSLVHIASHAYFDNESKRSFVVAYDRSLDLDMIEAMIRPGRYRGQAVELLVLSACQTAVGDGRAGLGLAGAALKSGARSVLATLWNVNDEATAQLVSVFYRSLVDTHGISKANALRVAQLELLSDPRYRHPCYWSPYLIVGNWL